eukprot:7906139-Heterocapsa_arctica.AAC.1
MTCMDFDGVRRFPITVPCIIFDNLNYIYHPKSGAFIGMPEEGWVKVRKLFTLMGRFRARLYVCSASAARWGLGSGFDHVSSTCRQIASDMEIPSWTGE